MDLYGIELIASQECLNSSISNLSLFSVLFEAINTFMKDNELFFLEKKNSE